MRGSYGIIALLVAVLGAREAGAFSEKLTFESGPLIARASFGQEKSSGELNLVLPAGFLFAPQIEIASGDEGLRLMLKPEIEASFAIFRGEGRATLSYARELWSEKPGQATISTDTRHAFDIGPLASEVRTHVTWKQQDGEASFLGDVSVAHSIALVGGKFSSEFSLKSDDAITRLPLRVEAKLPLGEMVEVALLAETPDALARERVTQQKVEFGYTPMGERLSVGGSVEASQRPSGRAYRGLAEFSVFF